MQRWLILLACFMLAPAVAVAADVQKLVDKAIDALGNTCYEARMRYMPRLDSDEVQEVLIHHVAPDLYRVEPLVNGEPGGVYYIENGKELMRVDQSGGRTPIVELLPLRQFHLDDTLKRNFLSELGKFQGTIVLNGSVGDYDVYVLRQDPHTQKPYTITVGLDKRNYFPLYLEVRDVNGKQRVYFEMTVIQYQPRLSFADSLFQVPRQAVAANSRAPRPPKQASNILSSNMTGPTCPLPPYPKAETLPSGYEVEGLTVLSYPRTEKGKQVQSMVFQYEILGPQPEDVMSLFLTQDLDVEFFMDSKDPDTTFGYLIQQQGDWLVAVFADQPAKVLQAVIKGLQADPNRTRELLEATQAREDIVQQALSESR
jgi:outer membrane lipoprotein-sorting protein